MRARSPAFSMSSSGGYDLQLVQRERLARDVLLDRDKALADQRDRHRVGTDVVARDAAHGLENAGQYISLSDTFLRPRSPR